jgi:hypothetical protein
MAKWNKGEREKKFPERESGCEFEPSQVKLHCMQAESMRKGAKERKGERKRASVKMEEYANQI